MRCGGQQILFDPVLLHQTSKLAGGRHPVLDGALKVQVEPVQNGTPKRPQRRHVSRPERRRIERSLGSEHGPDQVGGRNCHGRAGEAACGVRRPADREQDLLTILLLTYLDVVFDVGAADQSGAFEHAAAVLLISKIEHRQFTCTRGDLSQESHRDDVDVGI